jgi:hypothetical protein
LPPFDWRLYLPLAGALAGRRDEASERWAISRGYYAAYCVVRNRLRSEGNTVSGHHRLWKAYRTDSDPRRRQIGIDGGRLRRTRNKADYDDVVRNTAGEAAHAVRLARVLVHSVDAL